MQADEAFGQVLRELRLKRGWSQETLAFEAGVDRNYISLIELGRNSPSLKMIFKLCGALGITVRDCMSKVEAIGVETPTD